MALLYDLVLTYRCNWNCSYCSNAKSCNRSAAETEMPIDVVRAAMRYIAYSVKLARKFDPREKHIIVLFGGEPLLRMDAIKLVCSYAAQLGGIQVNIITNTSLVPKHQDELVSCNELLKSSGGSLCVIASYDYTLQNEYRKAGTYDTVRDNIRWLYHNDLLLKTVTVFTNSSFHRFPEVVEDVVALEKELPELWSSFNIDRCNNEGTEFDTDKVTAAFEAAAPRLAELPIAPMTMVYNSQVCGNKALLNPLCASGSVYMGVDIDGSVYPAYDVVFCNELCKKHCYIGSVFDPLDVLRKKQRATIARLGHDIPEPCKDCDLPCRFYPWTAITDDVSAYGQIPAPETLCPMNAFLGELFKKYW